ncbi:MAG: alpha/beta hydrolase [Saprospiraceae bacterium]|nr:alpha/beta hydrolase [Saprospiraceae bacterium]
MQTILYKDKKVAYSVIGQKGTPLVFLHGFCEDSSMWEDYLEPFEENRLILVDLPGLGKSEPVENITISYMAEAVLAVLNELNAEKFLLIGHSMGGYVALEVAKQAPEKLMGLGLFHSHPFADTDDKKGSRDKAVEFIESHGHQLFVKQFIPKLFVDEFARSHTFLVDKMIHRAARYTQEGITGALKAMKDRPDNAKVLEDIKVPVLFIVGELDTAIAYELSVEQTHLPAIADIHILPKVGHMGMFKAKRETQGIVRRFVQFCLERLN